MTKMPDEAKDGSLSRGQEMNPSSIGASVRMRRQPRRDTRPEVALRSELWRRGLRFRVDLPTVNPRRRADIVFTRARTAVFVDGCFWHRCPIHGSAPKSNVDWWAAKLDANVARDRETDAEMIASGWEIVRVWEHEDPSQAATRIEAVVRSRSICPGNQK